MTVLYLAALQGVPQELYEAAEIDGAGRIQMFRHLILPMLRRIILIVALLRIMEAFKIFDLIYVTTMGGPAAATKVISIDAYRISFLWWRIGYGAAYTQLIFFMVMIISAFLMKAGIWSNSISSLERKMPKEKSQRYMGSCRNNWLP